MWPPCLLRSLPQRTTRSCAVGGVRYTIKDGIVYDAKKLLADVRAMVKETKETSGKGIVQPGMEPLRALTPDPDCRLTTFASDLPVMKESSLGLSQIWLYLDSRCYHYLRWINCSYHSSTVDC